MTTLTQPSTGPVEPATGSEGGLPRRGIAPVRLVKAELLKILTTNSWWIFAIVMLGFTALALLVDVFQASQELSNAEQQRGQPMPDFGEKIPPQEGGPSQADLERMRQEYLASIDVQRILLRSAANVFTAGQFFGLLLIVVLGALIITNEYFHQTATATFLTTPRRTEVIAAKLAAAGLAAFGFWLVITMIDLAVGSMFFSAKGYGVPLTDWPVLRSVLMNLLAFVIWAVLGVGLGVLIRSQLGATLTGSALYLLSFPFAFIFFGLVRTFIIKHDWVWQWIAAVPGVASQIMVSPERLALGYNDTGQPILGPQWWVGAVVLAAYGVVAAVIGTLITRKRDIS